MKLSLGGGKRFPITFKQFFLLLILTTFSIAMYSSTLYPGRTRTLYWVGNGGDWSSDAHWSLESGGQGGASSPTLQDNVIFDNNSFTVDITVTVNDAAVSCNNMIWKQTNHTATFSGAGNLSVYGSLALNEHVIWDYYQLRLTGSGRGKELRTKSCHLKDVTFEGTGSEWIIHDSLDVENFTIQRGRIRFDNFTILHCSQILTIVSDSIELGNASIYTFYWENYMDPQLKPSALFDAGTSNIHCYQFNSRNQNYHKVDITSDFGYGIFISSNCSFKEATFTSNEIDFHECSNNRFENALFYGDVDVRGNATFRTAIFNGITTLTDTTSFDTLIFNNPGKSVTFQSGNVQTVNNLLVINSLDQNKITLKASTVGQKATFSLLATDLCFDYLKVQDLVVNSKSLFHAGSHSTNLGSNTSVIFTDCIPPISNVWSAKVNKENLVDDLSTGISISEVYPNPANSTANVDIESDHQISLQLEITDFTGKVLHTKTAIVDQGRITISSDIEEFATGIYFIKIVNVETGEVQTKKLIKS
ncbi:MAG TPA: T9SS type A sorting domain-containing protein [Bacteroidia bacterium]|jgi:hypothetical protein|nr:T9SS type A sorting domain-containing protein [Bacteroidia bacterium]